MVSGIVEIGVFVGVGSAFIVLITMAIKEDLKTADHWNKEIEEITCPCCQEVILGEGEEICEPCAVFMENVNYCDKHEILHTGKGCPRCNFSDLAPKL